MSIIIHSIKTPFGWSAKTFQIPTIHKTRLSELLVSAQTDYMNGRREQTAYHIVSTSAFLIKSDERVEADCGYEFGIPAQSVQMVYSGPHPHPDSDYSVLYIRHADKWYDVHPFTGNHYPVRFRLYGDVDNDIAALFNTPNA